MAKNSQWHISQKKLNKYKKNYPESYVVQEAL